MKNMILNIKKELLKEVNYYLDQLDSYYKTNEDNDFIKDCYFSSLIELYKKIRTLNKLQEEL